MTTKRSDPVVEAAIAKVERGLPLDLDERLAMNIHYAQGVANDILKDMDERRNANDSPVLFSQGTHNSIRLGVRMIVVSMYGLAALQADKRQAIEADVTKLWGRLVDLEERAIPVVRGTFNPKNDYCRGDQVALNGASFVARQDNPGPCPGAGWQLSAAQGKAGKPGPRVKSLTVDDQGMLTLINGDGSAVKCDLYPLLRKVQQG